MILAVLHISRHYKVMVSDGNQSDSCFEGAVGK